MSPTDRIAPLDESARPAATALIDSNRVGTGCQFASFAHVMAGAVIGDGCRIGAYVVIEGSVHIGRTVHIGHGAVIAGALEIKDEVHIGPGVTFVASPEASVPTPTRVGAGARLGARAVILPGVNIGAGAHVEAGSVVAHDVPPFARVAGQPARIAGFEGGKRVTAPAATNVPSALPTFTVRGASLHRLPRVADDRGNLSFGQVGTHLPFEPRRYFVVDGVPQGQARGDHAHRALHQFLVCLRGSCIAIVDDGTTREECLLDTPQIALHMEPMVWGTQYGHSTDAILLVLASDVYQESDYIRQYETFLTVARSDRGNRRP